MNNILLSWEKGLNLGHISRILNIANRLSNINHTPILSIPSDKLSSINIVNSTYCTIPTVDFLPSHNSINPTLSFASLLIGFGMAEKPYLLKALPYWKEVFTRYDIKAVVLDYAVITHLAAYIFNIKAFQITDGFCAPTKDFPLFIGVENTAENVKLNKINILLINKTINEVGFELTGRSDYTLEGYIKHVTKYYDTIPELDCYGQCTIENSLNVLPGITTVNDVRFQSAYSNVKVFCYLRKETYESKSILHVLEKNNIDTICFYSGDKEGLNSLKDELKQTSVFITDQFINFDTLIGQATHVISYGPSGTVTRACLSGKPQLIIPCDTQKQMIGQKAFLTKTVTVKEIGNNDIESLIRDFLSSEQLKSNAKEFSLRYKNHDFNKTIDVFISSLVT